MLPRAFPCVSSPLPPPFPLEISCYVFPCVRFRFPLGTPAALQTRQKRKEASASSMAPPSPPAATVADGRSNAPSTLLCSPRAFERARTNRTRRPIGHGVYIFNREENQSETTFSLKGVRRQGTEASSSYVVPCCRTHNVTDSKEPRFRHGQRMIAWPVAVVVKF